MEKTGIFGVSCYMQIKRKVFNILANKIVCLFKHTILFLIVRKQNKKNLLGRQGRNLREERDREKKGR